jgi:hypothetical protein
MIENINYSLSLFYSSLALISYITIAMDFIIMTERLKSMKHTVEVNN